MGDQASVGERRTRRAARVIRTPGTRFQPAQRAGASTSRTTGTALTNRGLISHRLTIEPPERRFAQARCRACAKRAAAALSSHNVYHTSASAPAPAPPPPPPPPLFPRTSERAPCPPAPARAAGL